jgi:hypothetical protein
VYLNKMENMISQAEVQVQDWVNAIAAQRDAALNGLAQAQAANAGLARQIESLLKRIVELEMAADHSDAEK